MSFQAEDKEKGVMVPPITQLLIGLIFFLFFFSFLGPHVWHTEVPRLGVKLELQLPAYTTATAMWDLNLVCDLHHSSRQHWIPNPLSGARDRTLVLMDTSRVCNH